MGFLYEQSLCQLLSVARAKMFFLGQKWTHEQACLDVLDKNCY